jgi:hypothetical protein
MGNACYINKHYSDVIQTREYRSPEVILEGNYYQETTSLTQLKAKHLRKMMTISLR